jgi:TonB family protein
MANVSAPILETQEDFQVPAQPKFVSFGSRACAAMVDAAIVIAIPYLLACAGFVAIDGASSLLNGKPFALEKAVQQVLFPEQLWKTIGSIEPVITPQNRDELLGQLVGAAQPFLNVMAVTSVLSLVFFAFNHLMLPSIDGQSLGKKLAGLRIVQEDGNPLSLNRLFLRNIVGYGLSSIFLVGYLFAFVDPQRRAWHDYISKTRVVWDSKDTALRGGFISSFMFHLLAIASSVLLAYFLKFLILWLKAIGLPIPALTTPPTQYDPVEYTLSNTAKPPKTERRSNANSVAGGKRNPKLAVSPGSPSAAKSQPKASKQPTAKSEPAPKEAPKQPKRPKVEPPKSRPVVVRQKPPEPKPKPEPKPEPKQEEPKPLLRQDPEPTPKPKPEPKAETPPPKPVEPPKPVATKPEPAPPEPPQEEKAEPGPPEDAPQPRKTRKSAIASGSDSGPLERVRTRKSDSSSLGSPLSRSAGSGGVGDSGAFNPDRDGPGEGIDAAQDVDFGPYMAELQRRVKRNWIPPEQGNSRRSVLRFSISRNGEISNLRVGKTSGNPDSDAAAMDAVRRAAPFRTLPSGYKGKNIDIQFTFDINVFGGDVTSN